MIKVFVRYILASNIFPKKEEITLDTPRLGYLVKKLEMHYGKNILKELFDPFTLILINGKQIRYTTGFDVELKDGDEIVFYHAIEGG
ncbi:MAG: MoaD/ThiS family protein [Candidatus Bathyarchaeia archaeon]